ncbi:unnamed protein product [Discula destructiva]
MANIYDVPDEIIRQIIQHVPPEEAFANCPLVSKTFKRVAFEPLLWKHFCLSSFRFWNSEHCLNQKLESRASKTPWRDLWRRRKLRNDLIAQLLRGIVATKVDRFSRMWQICRYGYDAKDYLLEQIQIPDSVEDSLARRYHANAVLASIHRGVAIDEWSRYQRIPQATQRTDRALAGFDMFFVRGTDGDIDDICALLDRIAVDFLKEQEKFESASTREKALALLKWLRLKNMTGMDDEGDNYRCLRNCLIGHALRDPNHPSLPIISCVIYVCLAERIGLRAACCAFPSHVHATVMAPSGYDLNGNRPQPPTRDVDRMFLNPYGSSEEVHLSDLRSRLVEFDWVHGHEAFLVPAPVPVLVQRVGRNIKMPFHDVLLRPHLIAEHLAILHDRPPSTRHTVQSAVYAADWANLLTTPASNLQWASHLQQFLHFLTTYFPVDAWLVDKYIVPLYTTYTQSVQPRQRVMLEDVPEVLRRLRTFDAGQATATRRCTQEIHQSVWYTVGQVFRHRRYGYIGIINGWSAKGTHPLPLGEHLPIGEVMDDISDSGSGSDTETVLARLKKKVFYTCLTNRFDRGVVSQDPIEIIRDPNLIPEQLMDYAGKFFRRFDRATCTFTSNIKEYYPDD